MSELALWFAVFILSAAGMFAIYHVGRLYAQVLALQKEVDQCRAELAWKEKKQ